jgi:hypothetical protein
MREHDVTALVLEDISYYRATEVFPELAGGTAVPPFASIGLQTTYQAPAGKPVYAYRLLPALTPDATSQGKTGPLARA